VDLSASRGHPAVRRGGDSDGILDLAAAEPRTPHNVALQATPPASPRRPENVSPLRMGRHPFSRTLDPASDTFPSDADGDPTLT
jgi:hypothetical protein